MKRIAIIGAGQAGCSAAFKLRQLGYEGPITLYGDEVDPPYQRPPLSKAYLLGEMSRERLYLRPRATYAEQGIDLKLGGMVSAIDPAAKTLCAADGQTPYDALILATGSSAMALPDACGGGLVGVYTLRTLADIDAAAPEFKGERKVLIVGGGYIGLEAASVCAKLGLQVTVVEMSDRILQRVACEQTADYFRALHRAHGVDVIEGVGLDELSGDARVHQAQLSNGTTLEVDFVLVGIGIRPNVALAESAGLVIDNGIRTDAFGRTSIDDIWAAGDCASFPYNGQQIRLESVPNAIAQAEQVAQNILGAETAYVAKPWFWSDQYDVKLQIAGLNSGFDYVVTRIEEETGSTSQWYYSGRTLVAVDAMNAPRAFQVGRRMIESGKSPNISAVADAKIGLKSLL